MKPSKGGYIPYHPNLNQPLPFIMVRVWMLLCHGCDTKKAQKSINQIKYTKHVFAGWHVQRLCKCLECDTFCNAPDCFSGGGGFK